MSDNPNVAVLREVVAEMNAKVGALNAAQYDIAVQDWATRLAAPIAQGEAVQGSPQWYVEELRTLADNITGRGVGICNGAALTIERLSAPGGVGDAVTEEMVHRACAAWNQAAGLAYATADRDCMHAALTAALAARTGKGESARQQEAAR